jgi:serine protease AprX
MAREKAGKAASKKRSARPEPAPHALPPEHTAGERAAAFNPDVESIVALPLLDQLMVEGLENTYDVIIDVNRDYPGGRDKAQERVKDLIAALVRTHSIDPRQQGVHVRKTELSKQYVFGRLRGDLIQDLVKKDRELAQKEQHKPALYRVWPDFEVAPLTYRTVATVKADVARNAFGAMGHDIVWAVLDSGIQASHPHFRTHRNLELPTPLRHCDFGVFDEEASERAALIDECGHGTHVAGIIAGELQEGMDERLDQVKISATVGRRDEHGRLLPEYLQINAISGMAPACKLISFKVLDKDGRGPVSNLIAACEKIQEINGNGSHIRVHGVNVSVGYDFVPYWFTSGQSPLCVELDRLVRSGVVVVVAAGNTGYGWNQSAFRGAVPAGMEMTINDPGNAELAITVGSTHPENPLRNGVSYFSSKGPTGDGRMKPDLVAPGERIISCCASLGLREVAYRANSGTSVAAAHVSGIIAAFLSACREFIGRPEEVKEIFLSNATDLKRAPSFQGRGLVDLFRALSYVRGVTETTMTASGAAPTWEAASAVRAGGEETRSPDDAAPIEVFISYSHKDKRLRMQLETHLSLLKRNGVIDAWHDRRIGAGQEWVGAIDRHLDSATIILLLVTAEFLASDYCYDLEMTRALERHEAGEAVVIPVILRDVDWTSAPFARLKALPEDGKPVTSWSTRDRALADIARGIRKVAEELRPPRRRAGRDGSTVRLDAVR